MPSMNLNARLEAMRKYGFWIRTKLPPYRALRWEVQVHEDGRPSFRGKNWVEILPHGSDKEPDRFYGADVEPVGPHEWMTYYPAEGEPACGWGQPRLPDGGMQYCPQFREEGEPFCRKHIQELQGDSSAEQCDEPAGDSPVPAAD